MDAISYLLQSVRITSVRLVCFELAGPFALSMPDLERVAEDRQAAPDEVVVLHLAAGGGLWVSAGEAPVELALGASLLAPGAGSHLVSASAGRPARVLDALAVARGAGTSSVRLGDAEHATSLVTALVRLARPLSTPLRTALGRAPLVVLPPGTTDACVSELLARLAEQNGDGGEALEWARALVELQLRSVLRRILTPQAVPLARWARGGEDARVERCLALLHADPGHPWSLAELSRRVYASRSALSLRFTELVGEPPMQYLTRLRLERARELLADRDATLAGVATEVGYDSDAAFQRAFKRAFGVPPGAFRRSVITSTPLLGRAA